MKIEITEINEKIARFRLTGTDAQFANALRRSAMGMVKTFAISNVTMYENTSAMFDEYITHRIGLIPISTPTKGYGETDEVLFTLDATGPKTVYSKDMESSDATVKVANDNIPIMKLGDEQRLRLDGKAKLGSGATHARFQPGLISYEANDDNTSFDFYVETFGQMTPHAIINKAFDAIKEEIEDVRKTAKKL
jgi:DNA-directed RNA polymerase subunit D